MTIAVLGLGSIGLRHAKNLLSLGEEVCGFDPDDSRREMADGCEVRFVRSRDEALKGAEAVVVASPNDFHLEDLEAAVSAGCHVFVEKPLAHSAKRVEPVLTDARSKELVVFAALNLRFHPAVQHARELLASEEIGKILWARFICSSFLPDWRPDQDYRNGYAADPDTGGVLFDVIHEFDLANHFFGPGEAVGAKCRKTGMLDIPTEDCADVILRHPGGVQSSLHLDYITRPPMRVAEIAGSNGFLRLDLRNRFLIFQGTNGEKLQEKKFNGSVADDYRTEMAAFLRCVREGLAPQCDGFEALSVLRQVLEARKLCGLLSA